MLKIPHNKPSLSILEKNKMAAVVDSGWIVQGPESVSFERKLKEICDFEEGEFLSLSSGTAALFLSLKFSGLPLQSKVAVPSYACSALLNAVYLSGMKPVILDISPDDFNIDVKSAKDSFDAMIAVHTYGVPFDIRGLAPKNCFVIEDCAQAFGSKVNGKSVGSTGDVGVFSFYASKMIATGYGGALYSKDESFLKHATAYRKYEDSAEYEVKWPVQMSDIHAAMGIAQLEKLGDFLSKRHHLAQMYSEIATKKGWRTQKSKMSDVESNNYRYVIVLDQASEVERLRDWMAQAGVSCIVPIEEWELLHIRLGQKREELPVCLDIASRTLSLPIFPGLFDGDQHEAVLERLRSF